MRYIPKLDELHDTVTECSSRVDKIAYSTGNKPVFIKSSIAINEPAVLTLLITIFHVTSRL